MRWRRYDEKAYFGCGSRIVDYVLSESGFGKEKGKTEKRQEFL